MMDHNEPESLRRGRIFLTLLFAAAAFSMGDSNWLPSTADNSSFRRGGTRIVQHKFGIVEPAGFKRVGRTEV